MSTITTRIELVLKHLQQGEIAAIPTETVYGLAANAENEQAIRKVYAMKNRPLNHPLIMHVAENRDLSRWVSQIPEYAHLLMKHFWPGPLTLVLPSKPEQVSPLITGGQNTIALRCPKHPLTQELLHKLSFPLVAPSANPFGKISPTTAEHVQNSFKNQTLLILDGGRCPVGIESTIVGATNPHSYEILRPGLIGENQIDAILSVRQYAGTASIRVPGKLDSHYQPEKSLYCFPDAQAINNFLDQNSKDIIYVLAFSPIGRANLNYYYRFPTNPEQTAYELYYQLRRADQSKALCIAIELPPSSKQWEGIRERIVKASHHRTE